MQSPDQDSIAGSRERLDPTQYFLYASGGSGSEKGLKAEAASGAQSLDSLLSVADLRSLYSNLLPPLVLVRTCT